METRKRNRRMIESRLKAPRVTSGRNPGDHGYRLSHGFATGDSRDFIAGAAPVSFILFPFPRSLAVSRTRIACLLARFNCACSLPATRPSRCSTACSRSLPEFTTTFGVSPAQSALSVSVTTASLAIAIFVAGFVSEGWSRHRLMTLSLTASSLLTIIVAFLPSWHALLFVRALEGLALGGVPAVAMAYLAEEVHPDGLGLAMGLYVGGTAIGGMAGRVISGDSRGLLFVARGYRRDRRAWAACDARVPCAPAAVATLRAARAAWGFAIIGRRSPSI